MILYLDASALVKRYIAEAGSQDVNAWIAAAESLATSLITRTEVAAALTRAYRLKLITGEETQRALQIFRSEWESLLRLPLNEATVARGDFLACEHGLRGYDAIHLATALLWKETLGLPVTLATYDRQLLEIGRLVKLEVLPEHRS